MFGIVWYENDRKNMENLLKHKLEKMLIFDRKILEVAIVSLNTDASVITFDLKLSHEKCLIFVTFSYSV